jgi:two-component system response regulator DesR
VLMVGESALAGDCLASALAAHHNLTVVVANPDEAVHLPSLGSLTDVILLNGDATTAAVVAAIATLSSARPSSPILVLASRAEPAVIGAFLQAGASGYVDREQSLSELWVAIGRVRCGRWHFSPEQVFRQLQRAPAARPRVSLTARERQVLQATAGGLTAAEAAAALQIATPTFRTHLQRAMVKLQARTRIHAVTLALKYGLIQLADVEASAQPPEAEGNPFEGEPFARVPRKPGTMPVGDQSWMGSEGHQPIRLLKGAPQRAEDWRGRAGEQLLG